MKKLVLSGIKDKVIVRRRYFSMNNYGRSSAVMGNKSNSNAKEP
jgi:hypothetical protein